MPKTSEQTAGSRSHNPKVAGSNPAPGVTDQHATVTNDRRLCDNFALAAKSASWADPGDPGLVLPAGGRRCRRHARVAEVRGRGGARPPAGWRARRGLLPAGEGSWCSCSRWGLDALLWRSGALAASSLLAAARAAQAPPALSVRAGGHGRVTAGRRAGCRAGCGAGRGELPARAALAPGLDGLPHALPCGRRQPLRENLAEPFALSLDDLEQAGTRLQDADEGKAFGMWRYHASVERNCQPSPRPSSSGSAGKLIR